MGCDGRDPAAAGGHWSGRSAGRTARTLCGVLALTAERSGGEPAYSDRDDDGPWQTITWGQTRQQALELAAGLIELGLQPGERVALMMPNRVEHVLADLGVVHAGGVPVTFYATLAADQIGYVAGDCDARIAVLDGASELARWQAVLAELPAPDEDHRQGRGCVPVRRSVPDLGGLRRAGPGAARRRARTRWPTGWRRSARMTRPRSSTPRVPPATRRASSSPTAACCMRSPPADVHGLT